MNQIKVLKMRIIVCSGVGWSITSLYCGWTEVKRKFMNQNIGLGIYSEPTLREKDKKKETLKNKK